MKEREKRKKVEERNIKEEGEMRDIDRDIIEEDI